MRTLQNVRPTPEQLAIVSRNRLSTDVIRGAAGSGKTTTALLRLRSLIGLFVNRRKRQNQVDQVRILVLTYNRTLRGYIDQLTREQIAEGDGIELRIATFSNWAWKVLERPSLVDESEARETLCWLGRKLALPPDFVAEEAEYVLGRFLPADLDDYLGARRHGRGNTPRMGRSLRNALLKEVIRPYRDWIDERGAFDWNDLAVALATNRGTESYDVIIVDEAQDFSANQLRAVQNHRAEPSSLTLIADTAQRIYARGYTWAEAGIRVQQSWRLSRNYRNTAEIANFAAPLVQGIPLDDDGTIPNLEHCERHGKIPIVVKGKFRNQCAYAIDYINREVDLLSQSVAFLHPRGGGWFNYVKNALSHVGLPYVEMPRVSDWPRGDENIALSTMHSAKGLEFDHVIMIGLNAEVMPHGDEEEDDRLYMLRRLLAMGISRARDSVLLGYKPEDASDLIDYLDHDTYDEVNV